MLFVGPTGSTVLDSYQLLQLAMTLFSGFLSLLSFFFLQLVLSFGSSLSDYQAVLVELHNEHRLNTLSLEYTALEHTLFLNHRVRVKKTEFCDPTVKCGARLLTDSLAFTVSTVFT
jgi:hypothetical protein